MDSQGLPFLDFDYKSMALFYYSGEFPISLTANRSFLKTIFAYMQTMPVIGGFLSKYTFSLSSFIIIIPTGKNQFVHKMVDFAASDGKKVKAEV